MSNMSYCRMENTYNDLLDVYNNWDNASSESELKYRDKILHLCKQIIFVFDEDEKQKMNKNIKENQHDKNKNY